MFIAREDFGFTSGICKHFVVRLREVRAVNQLNLLNMKQGKNCLYSIARDQSLFGYQKSNTRVMKYSMPIIILWIGLTICVKMIFFWLLASHCSFPDGSDGRMISYEEPNASFRCASELWRENGIMWPTITRQNSSRKLINLPKPSLVILRVLKDFI